ncbi:MAG TPA: ABC transporter permease [Balneola sp.]|jgi:phospholipid/cholesterol/gamma-HCH transport system permease protein|nr:ABC transporter permease [Balneola sp.]MAO77928.1 ABC transporter permease [Balneola sp.]MBF65280.1 ABC transporter permease [Balneola sp.]HAH51441.1 ABC transporter permease [Balneola sp.]HAW81826.1 ABC transporter permease [Balneola sp.]|tara:strand:+ start:17031 stop:17768 length:738 start_codon:yes stop_codon:yes gene_type:complete
MEALKQLGQYTLLLYQALRSVTEFSTYRENLFNEFVKVGYQSIPIIMLVGVFTGAVLTLQTAYQLDTDLYPAYIVGSIVAQSVIIELAAVISGLVLAGKVGARISTELGTMRVSEQIDALESMGFNSVAFLVLPRIFAGVLMFPVLYIIASTLGIIGGVVAGAADGILPAAEFMKGGRQFFFPEDVVFGILKSFVFGFVITSISCFKGYFAFGGAEGVGNATTQATVLSCIYILLADFVLAAILL